MRRAAADLGVALLTLALSACSSLEYFAHLAGGQMALLRAREPIAEVVADTRRDPVLRRRLAYALEARQWAVGNLGLPDNASYTSYADLHRPFTVWNVFAAGELSLKPLVNCFPVAGCVAYQGYYALNKAEAHAAELRAEGKDTFVAGSLAYSTLGHFDDPLVSPLLRYDDARLAATIFHELSHQVVYVSGETAFNESFATFVERVGGAQWLASRGAAAPKAEFRERDDAFKRLLLQCRADLQPVYASASLSDADKRAAKAQRFSRLANDYAALKASWNGWEGYDWFWVTPMNNAKLLPFGLYHQFVPAFAIIYDQAQRSWPAFYAAVARLAQLTPAQRTAELTQLMTNAVSPFP